MSVGLTADAIKEIERLTEEGKRVSFKRPDGFPQHQIVRVGPDGVAETIDVPTGALAIELDTPQQFVNFVMEHLEDDEPHVFYDPAQLLFSFDLLGPRQDLARCILKRTAELQWLAGPAKDPLQQAPFVRLLRITLRRCLADTSLLNLVRNLKWSVGADGEQNIQHGRESMGRSITSEIRGESAIPEEIVLNVPVWENYQYASAVACAIEIFPDTKQFKLTPFPGELERAVETGLDDIARLFEVEGFPLRYQGRK